VVSSSIQSLPRLADVQVDAAVLAYTAAIAAVTALLFGVLPARRQARGAPHATLRGGSRGNALEARSGVWRFLVDAEVALALVLLVGSGLLIRSFQSLVEERPGFDDSRVDVLGMSLSQIKYPDAADHARWYRAFLEQVRSLPGVADAGVVSSVPIADGLPNGRLELDDNLSATAPPTSTW
jgi:hypothetical protein